MLLIRRMDDGKRSYTAILLPGEPPKIFPTSQQEHARILQIYKQDRPHPDVLNDFSDYQIGGESLQPGTETAGSQTKQAKRKRRSLTPKRPQAMPVAFKDCPQAP